MCLCDRCASANSVRLCVSSVRAAAHQQDVLQMCMHCLVIMCCCGHLLMSCARVNEARKFVCLFVCLVMQGVCTFECFLKSSVMTDYVTVNGCGIVLLWAALISCCHVVLLYVGVCELILVNNFCKLVKDGFLNKGYTFIILQNLAQ